MANRRPKVGSEFPVQMQHALRLTSEAVATSIRVEARNDCPFRLKKVKSYAKSVDLDSVRVCPFIDGVIDDLGVHIETEVPRRALMIGVRSGS